MPILSSIKTQQFVAILCSIILLPAQSLAWQDNQQAPSSNQQQAPALTPDQLDSLVAPIALYPDPLLSQILVASTYPLEIVECARWFDANSSLQGQALKDAVSKQSWDASVQALVAFPDVLKQLNTNISWTTDLGNAFLAQQADVMESVQRLRTKAQSAGKLTSNEQQKVTTSSSGGNTYIEIQPANPQVIYVPSYNPEAVWGAPPAYYPYPPIAYPPYYGAGAVAAGVISFGAGMALGAFWGGGGGWGWNAGWGGNNINVNNNFIRQNNFNRTNIGNGNTWQHNPAHRAGVPYSNSNLANRYGGNGNFNNRNGNFNRNDLNNVNRNNNANRNNLGQNANRNLNNAGQNANRNLNNMGQNANRNPGQNADRSMGQNANRNMGQMQNRGGQADRQTAGFGSGGGGNQFGNRQMSSGGFNSGGANRSAFGGMNQGGGRTQMNSMRGGGSMGGGGFHGGGGRGGGFGGGGRGGGGRGGRR